MYGKKAGVQLWSEIQELLNIKQILYSDLFSHIRLYKLFSLREFIKPVSRHDARKKILYHFFCSTSRVINELITY